MENPEASGNSVRFANLIDEGDNVDPEMRIKQGLEMTSVIPFVWDPFLIQKRCRKK
jgi:hypothetical protein